MKKNLLKQGLALLLTLCCVLTLIPAMTVETTATELEGDVWDGSITQPTKMVEKDGIMYYEITKCAELAYVAQTGGEWLTYNYILGNNLILNEVEFTWDEEGNLTNPQNEIDTLHQWIPLGSSSASFSGIFNGNSCNISGMYINNDSEEDVGLFGRLSGSITDVFVYNSYIISSFCEENIGGIVGAMRNSNSNITNCLFNGFIKKISLDDDGHAAYVGGIVGNARYGIISNCKNYGWLDIKENDIENNRYITVGGVVGDGEVDYCENYGSVCVRVGARFVGGIIGRGDASYCKNYGIVNGGESYAGGIIGYGTAIHCENYGSVYATNNAHGGGISARGGCGFCINYGNVLIDKGVVGGISGEGNGISCINLGNIETREGVAGGISGNGGDSIKNCMNYGNVVGTVLVGGIAGKIIQSVLANCYNLATVTGTTNVGAIAGTSDHYWGDRSIITNCYYAKTPGINDSLYAFGNRTADGSIADDATGIAEPKNHDELKQQSTFVNWDFDTVWAIDPTVNDGYPYLRWQTFSDNPVEVNSVTLDQTALTLSAGDATYLTATVSPATATDKTLTWTTSATSVATVTPAGKVTAVAPGTATITAASADGKHSASCTVTVNPRAADEYTLTALTVRDTSGNPHTTVPATSFWATVTVRNNTSSGNTTVLLAAYSADGQYLDLYAAQTEDVPVGASVKLSFLVPNTDGKVAQIKAFCVASLENLTPLSKALTVGS